MPWVMPMKSRKRSTAIWTRVNRDPMKGLPLQVLRPDKSTVVSGGLQRAEVDLKFRKALLKVLEQYEPVFKKLAES